MKKSSEAMFPEPPDGSFTRIFGFDICFDVADIGIIAVTYAVAQHFGYISVPSIRFAEGGFDVAVHAFIECVDHGAVHEMIVTEQVTEAFDTGHRLPHLRDGDAPSESP